MHPRIIGKTVHTMAEVANEHVYPNKPKPERAKKIQQTTCSICSREFSYSNHGRVPKTCGPECRKKANYDRRRTLITHSRTCKHCKKPFESRNKGRVFCSPNCRIDIAYETIACAQCKTKFEVLKTLKQRFCSISCSNIHRHNDLRSV